MNLRLALRSRLVAALSSETLQTARRRTTELARRLRRRSHVVMAFVELDDPHSYLLCHYLAELHDAFAITLDVRVAESLGGAYRPEPQRYVDYALTDSRRLAAELGIPFLDRGAGPPIEHRRAMLASLALQQHRADFTDEVIAASTAYWRGDSEAAARWAQHDGAQRTADMLGRNTGLLKSLGHYDAASVFYAGEWYRGIDRLRYLVERLDSLGLRKHGTATGRLATLFQSMQVKLPAKPPSAAQQLPAVEFFHSFRSPYSYLLFRRACVIASAFGLALKVRPVLPMVMRGLPVPRAKLRYIVLDAGREARRLGIEFGRIADPLGAGVERCMATLQYAVTQHRDREFVVAAGRAIFARGIDVASDRGLRSVTARAGLFWPDVKAALADDSWRSLAERNRADMMATGLWGVPVVRVGERAFWGQDRDWLLVRYLEDLCDNGEGILI